jgi:hypothetical protein
MIGFDVRDGIGREINDERLRIPGEGGRLR